MTYWGINALNHGSSIAVIEDDCLRSWIVHQEDELPLSSIYRALRLGTPDTIFWYEKPWVKKSRQLYAGQFDTAADLSVLPSRFLLECDLADIKVRYTPHHASHAAAGYYTSPFEQAAIVVIDAIGEWDCASIWHGVGDQMTKVWSKRYPHSLGLFYSAFTKLIGLEPIKQEGTFQQMSSKGDADRYRDFITDNYMQADLQAMQNLHRGVSHWPYPPVTDQDRYDIAAAVQDIFEQQVRDIMIKAQYLTKCSNLVYMGGCAMNSQANRRVVTPMWKKIWSLPIPGDPSSAIGAILYHTKKRIQDHKWDPVKHIEIKLG